MTNESNEHLSIGYKIGGHYEVVKVLGQGGFGIVYLVKDIHRLNAFFVIKELFSREFSFRHRDGKTVYNKAEAKKIFTKIKEDIISEVNILQRIRNRNIVEAYGYFEENNTLYSVMEFIDGIDLDKYLKEVPPFSENEARDLLFQIINGIKEIHNLNILHRDIKPSNIMKTKDGVYKLIDFTTNRTYIDNQMTTVTAFQSPIYTPPELSGNKRAIIGKFSDIYSIGMTICRVMAEDEETLPNITDRLIDDSEFIDILNGFNISSNFRNILFKMTKIDAEERFQDLEEIEKLLSQTQTNFQEENEKEIEEEIKPSPKRNIKRPPKKEEKDNTKSWFTIIGILLAVVLLALGGYAYKIVKLDKDKGTTQNKSQSVTTYKPKQEKVEDKEEEPEIKSEIKPLEIPEIKDTPTPTPTPSPLIEDEIKDDSIEIVTPIPTPTRDKSIEIVTPSPTPTKDKNIEIVATPIVRHTPAPTHNNISLGRMIQAGKNINLSHKSPFNRASVQDFLLRFIPTAEHGSINHLLSFYNYRVDRYFSLRNITHKEIYRDKARYNKKWVHRRFRLISFDILYKYKKNGIEYCDIKKRMSYRVVSRSGKVAEGTSNTLMTLKATPYGFKVVSIYSIR